MKYTIGLLFFSVLALGYISCGGDAPKPLPKTNSSDSTTTVTSSAKEGEIDSETGLIVADGWQLVKQNCLSCHTSDLIVQNQATSAGWLSTIRWMQEKQGLWDLGQNEKPILAYLSKNYAPKATGRRKPLTDVEWYVLGEEGEEEEKLVAKKEVPERSGIEVYSAYCVSCHGATGNAERNGAKDLSKSKLDIAGIRKIVSNGSKNGKMVSYGNILKTEEIEKVAGFVKELQK